MIQGKTSQVFITKNIVEKVFDKETIDKGYRGSGSTIISKRKRMFKTTGR